jgi:hypothetical protein
MTHFRLRLFLAVAGVMLGLAVVVQAGEPKPCPPTLEQLRHMNIEELQQLFSDSDMGRPLVGYGRGRLICSTDKHPRVRIAMTNTLWRGKTAAEDGSFVNHWIGGVDVIDSRYVVGPSWIDGKPAMLFEYPPGTPICGNMHDELREVAPGLYIGPLYDRCPVPKLRGFLAVQVECGAR